MGLHVIEGTWDEIKQHEAEFIGQILRVTIKPQTSAKKWDAVPSEVPINATKPKKLRAYGAYRDDICSSDEFAREKRAEIEKEDLTHEQKVLRGMGALKGLTGGTEAFMREKRAEIEREYRNV
jgi:hypothetical protein